MKKLTSGVFIVILAVAVLVSACAGPATTPVTTPAATPTPGITPSPVATPTPGVTPSPGATPVASPRPSPAATPAASPKPGEPTPKSGGHWVHVLPHVPGTALGNTREASGPTVMSVHLVLETMVYLLADGTMMPRLATKWEIDSTSAQPSITFFLRKGVKFHDGTDFNAEAVKWNLEFIREGVHAATMVFIRSIDIIDSHTIKVNFTEWLNTLPATVGRFWMISPTAFQKNGLEWIRWNMVGTGPFTQVEYRHEVRLVTKKNPNYWDPGLPYLDGVTYLYITDDMTAQAALMAGEGDTLHNRNQKLAKELFDAGFEVQAPFRGINMLIPSSKDPAEPWSRVQVRQAAEHAINKEAIGNAFGYGYDIAAYQVASPFNSAFNKDLKPRTYDLERARQLLREAGFPSGFRTKMIVHPAADRNIAVAMKEDLAKVGIMVDLEFPEIGAFTRFQRGTHYGLMYTPVTETVNFQSFFDLYIREPPNWFHSMAKPAGWQALLDRSRKTPLPDPVLLQELSKMVFDFASVIPITYAVSSWSIRKGMRNIGIEKVSPVWEPEARSVWMETTVRR
ncbi:MAG TPA: ABC transporter substrate-binding protein [Dehalococcoidales bacterium]|nr:ABC transporter substrate-binding protein [Dehalococcoidales bacterium]